MPSARIEQAEMFEAGLAMPDKRTPIEHRIQSGFFKLVQLHERLWPELRFAFAVPNGEVRPKIKDDKGRWWSPGGRRLREEGMRPGVPDFWFPVPRGGFQGWICEFKAPGRYPTAVQQKWLCELHSFGWQTHVYRDAEEAWKALKAYLELPVKGLGGAER